MNYWAKAALRPARLKRVLHALGLVLACMIALCFGSHVTKGYAYPSIEQVPMDQLNRESLKKKSLRLPLDSCELHLNEGSGAQVCLVTAQDAGFDVTTNIDDLSKPFNGSQLYLTVKRPDHAPSAVETFTDLGYVLFKHVKQVNGQSLDLKVTFNSVTTMRPDVPESTYQTEQHYLAESGKLTGDDIATFDFEPERISFFMINQKRVVEASGNPYLFSDLVVTADPWAYDPNWMSASKPSIARYAYEKHHLAPLFYGTIDVDVATTFVDQNGNPVEYPIEQLVEDLDIFLDNSYTNEHLNESCVHINTPPGYLITSGPWAQSACESIALAEESGVETIKIHSDTELIKEGRRWYRPLDHRQDETLTTEDDASILKSGFIALSNGKPLRASYTEMGGAGIGLMFLDRLESNEIAPTKSVTVSQAGINDTLTYKIDFTIPALHGTYLKPLESYRVTDTLPASLTYLENSAHITLDGAPITDEVGRLEYNPKTRALSYTFNPEWISQENNQRGQKVTLTFDAQIDPHATDTSIINTLSTVIDDEIEFNDKTETPLEPSNKPVPQLTQTVDKERVSIGEMLTYTITYDNTAQGSFSENLALHEQFPSGVTIEHVDVHMADGSLQPAISQEGSHATISCSTVRSVDGPEAVVTVRARIQDGFTSSDHTPSGEIAAHATAKATNHEEVSADVVSKILDESPLTLTKVANQDHVQLGDTCSWSITVTNTQKQTEKNTPASDKPDPGATSETPDDKSLPENSGDNDDPPSQDVSLRGITITDLLDNHFEAVSLTSNDGVDVPFEMTQEGLSWLIDQLKPQEQQVYTLTTKYIKEASANELTNSVEATLENGAIPPVTSSDRIRISRPQIELKKHTQKDTYLIGEHVTYYVDVTNTGNDPIHNLSVLDGLSEGLEGSPLSASIPELAPHETKTFEVVCSLSPDAPEQITNTAVVKDEQGIERASASALIGVTTPTVPPLSSDAPEHAKQTQQSSFGERLQKSKAPAKTSPYLPKTADPQDRKKMVLGILGISCIAVYFARKRLWCSSYLT